MDLRNYLSLLRKSWVLLLVMTLLGGGIGTALYLLTPRTYATTIEFYVSTPTRQNNNPQASGQFAESRVNSYILLLSSEQLAQRVVSTSGVDLSPTQVAQRITASAEINTVVIKAVVRDTSTDRSMQIAKGVAASFGPLVDDLDNVGSTTPVVIIHAVSGPTLSTDPVSPNRAVYIGGGLLAGLVLGALIALLASTRRRPQEGGADQDADSARASDTSAQAPSATPTGWDH